MGKLSKSAAKFQRQKFGASKNVAKSSKSVEKRVAKDPADDRRDQSQGARAEDDGDTLYGIFKSPNIKNVQFGIDKCFPTWYGSTVYFDRRTMKLGIYHDTPSGVASPAKKKTELDTFWLDTLYVCEYCFKYTAERDPFLGHVKCCTFKHRSPGRIKYKSPEYTIRRVKGFKHQLFCQNLCLFTKLYLDNKSMYFKVEHYDFYILYQTGLHKPMAFFSKELISYSQNNLACILTFPPYQRKRLGSLLIEFSYKLSQADGIVSGPELPLSPFGLVGYLKYWSRVICWHMVNGVFADLDGATLEELSTVTGLRINDLITTLKYLQCVGPDNKIYLSVLRNWLTATENRSFKFQIEDEFLLVND